ncbi:MAG TPA: hypothetical protein VM755_22115 [Stellaceae bacterium]|nr:hypothetical protein [Stellaceae bacterium]
MTPTGADGAPQLKGGRSGKRGCIPGWGTWLLGSAALALPLSGCAPYHAYPPYSAVGAPPYPYGYPHQSFAPQQPFFVPEQAYHELQEQREEREEHESVEEEQRETSQQEQQEEHEEHEWGKR